MIFNVSFKDCLYGCSVLHKALLTKYYHMQATVRRKLFYALFYTPNVYVWPTKRVRLPTKRLRLADKTCMFGWQNVHV